MPSTVITLNPNAQGFYNNWAGGGAKVAAVSDNSDATGLAGDPANEGYLLEDIPVPGSSLVSQIKLYNRYTNQDTDGSYKMGMRLNGIDVETLAPNFAGPGLTNVSTVWTTKPGGGAFVVTDVNALEVYSWVNYATHQPALVKVWLEVTYDPIPLELEKVRVKETHRLLLRRQARSLIYVTAPLPLADPELLSLTAFSHKDGASADGLGWGEKSWQRRIGRLLQSTIDLKTMQVQLVAQDWRTLIVLLYDEARTRISSSSYANGIGRIYVGARTYNRDSKAWVLDPSDGIVREIAYDVEQFSANELIEDWSVLALTTAGGQLLEDAGTNELLYSSFVSGTSGLTLGGTGTNGSAMAVDTSDTIFDTTITPNSLKFTAGSPHAANLTAQWPATASWSANTIGKLSIVYKNDDATAPLAEALYWRLVRSVDGRYFDNSNGTWSVATVDNALTQTSGAKNRFVSSLIDVGGSATTLTLTLLQKSGGTASRIDHVYHVQLEKSRWASSLIVTNAATVTRTVSTLNYENGNTAATRNWPTTQGTMKWEYTAEGLDAAAASGGPYFLNLTFDASNWFRCYYDAADSHKLKFEVRVAGVTYTAYKVIGGMARGTAMTIALRWTSSEAELGLAAGTISIFVNGVKGTDVVAGAMPTETASSTLYLGCNGSTTTARGTVRRWFVTPIVWTDEEIAREVPEIAR